MRRVTRVALDTSRGRTFDMSKRLFAAGETGTEAASLAVAVGLTDDKLRQLLRFLSRIGVAESVSSEGAKGLGSRPRWRMTEKLRCLWELVNVTVATVEEK
jgi:hypothetical protein